MKRTAFGSALALAALASAQTAQAQNVCVQPEDAADAMIYFMPAAYDATMTKCENQFSADSFLTSEDGRLFIDGFRGQQDARWSGTYRFFQVFIQKQAKGDEAMGQMIANLPEDSLRPLIDGIMGQVIAQEVKSDSCEKIDRVVELLSPLPPENLGGLIAFILPEVDLKDPPVCGSKKAAAVPPPALTIPPPAPPRADEGS